MASNKLDLVGFQLGRTPLLPPKNPQVKSFTLYLYVLGYGLNRLRSDDWTTKAKGIFESRLRGKPWVYTWTQGKGWTLKNHKGARVRRMWTVLGGNNVYYFTLYDTDPAALERHGAEVLKQLPGIFKSTGKQRIEALNGLSDLDDSGTEGGLVGASGSSGVTFRLDDPRERIGATIKKAADIELNAITSHPAKQFFNGRYRFRTALLIKEVDKAFIKNWNRDMLRTSGESKVPKGVGEFVDMAKVNADVAQTKRYVDAIQAKRKGLCAQLKTLMEESRYTRASRMCPALKALSADGAELADRITGNTALLTNLMKGTPSFEDIVGQVTKAVIKGDADDPWVQNLFSVLDKGFGLTFGILQARADVVAKTLKALNKDLSDFFKKSAEIAKKLNLTAPQLQRINLRYEPVKIKVGLQVKQAKIDAVLKSKALTGACALVQAVNLYYASEAAWKQWNDGKGWSLADVKVTLELIKGSIEFADAAIAFKDAFGKGVRTVALKKFADFAGPAAATLGVVLGTANATEAYFKGDNATAVFSGMGAVGCVMSVSGFPPVMIAGLALQLISVVCMWVWEPDGDVELVLRYSHGYGKLTWTMSKSKIHDSYQTSLSEIQSTLKKQQTKKN